jgi:hypothetical protein
MVRNENGVKLFKNKEPEQADSKLKEINDRLEKLELAVDKLSQNVDIHIENFNVNDPVLENLTFRLDKLDIKELSGALNMGNNFGVKVKENSKPKEKKKKDDKLVIKQIDPNKTGIKEKRETKTPIDKSDSFERRSSGYTFKFGQKKN